MANPFYLNYDPSYEDVELDTSDPAELEAFIRESEEAEAYANEFGFPQGDIPPDWESWPEYDENALFSSANGQHPNAIDTSQISSPSTVDDPQQQTSQAAAKIAEPKKIVNPFIHLPPEEPAMKSDSDIPTTDVTVLNSEMVNAQTAQVCLPGQVVTMQQLATLGGFTTVPVQQTTQAFPATPQIVENKNDKINPHALMKAFVERFLILVSGGVVYYYDRFFYRRLTEDETRTKIEMFCTEIVGNAVNTRLVSEIYGQLLHYAPVIFDDLIIDDRLIASESGLYDIRSRMFITPHPSQRCFHYLPTYISAEYAGEEKCPRFSGFICSVAGGNAALIQRMWELTALLLTPMRLKMLPILFGLPSSGKSVYVSVIKKLHLRGDSFSLTFKKLAGRFGLYYACHANVITYYDAPDRKLDAEEVAILKSICSTDDAITVEKKGAEVRELVSTRLKILISSNFMVRGYTNDAGLDSRIRYFAFVNSIPANEQVEHLADLIVSEAPAIVSTAILKYLPPVMDRGFVLSGEAETQILLEQLSTAVITDENEKIRKFIEDCIVSVPGNKISTAVLHTAFIKYCKGSIHFKLDSKFSAAFRAAIGNAAEKCRISVGEKSVNGFTNIALKPMKD